MRTRDLSGGEVRSYSFSSLVAVSGSEVELAAATEHGQSLCYRFGLDRRARVPALLYPESYLDDHVRNIHRHEPDWLVDIAWAALTSCRREQCATTAYALRAAYRPTIDSVAVVADDSRGDRVEWTFRRAPQNLRACWTNNAGHETDSALPYWSIDLAELIFESDCIPLLMPHRLWQQRHRSCRPRR